MDTSWAERIAAVKKHRKIIAVSLILAMLVLVLLIYQSDLLPPKVVTTECPFCQLYPSDGLALVDTQTGNFHMVEIWLHDVDTITEPGDWETQLRNGDHSTFSFMRMGQITQGSMGTELNHMGGTLLSFTPEEINTIAYFCPEHASLAIASYVLVDRKQRDAYEVYPIQPGESFSFRHYSVSVELEDGYYKVSIESDLFERDVAQWRAERERGQAD